MALSGLKMIGDFPPLLIPKKTNRGNSRWPVPPLRPCFRDSDSPDAHGRRSPLYSWNKVRSLPPKKMMTPSLQKADIYHLLTALLA